MVTDEYILSSDNLNVYYGNFQALANVSIKIKSNIVTALIGPSGCGKSTLLRCFNRMNDLIPIFSLDGSIKYKSQELYDDTTDATNIRSQIGMVFQKPNPFPKSIYDNVAIGLKINGYTGNYDEAIENSLRRAALWEEVKDRLDEPGTGLSGGQQQRLCIARAISVNPEVILMDEPCSALDPIATAKIEELIDELKKTYTIVIVTHSMAQAVRVSQKTGFFHLGKLIEVGKTEKIFKNPDNKMTQDYITGRFG